jgi:hypothetical protein
MHLILPELHSSLLSPHFSLRGICLCGYVTALNPCEVCGTHSRFVGIRAKLTSNRLADAGWLEAHRAATCVSLQLIDGPREELISFLVWSFF